MERNNQIAECMQAEVQQMAEDLGIPTSFESDPDLRNYRRGSRLLTNGELHDGMVVWGYYLEDGNDEPQVDGAFRLEKAPAGFILDDGSSFAADFDATGEPDSICEEHCCGWTKRLYEAVPVKGLFPA